MSAGSCTGAVDESPVTGNNPAGPIPGAISNRDHSQPTTTCRVSHSVKFVQLNLHHSKTATAVLCKQISDLQDAVIFIQEPWTDSWVKFQRINTVLQL